MFSFYRIHVCGYTLNRIYRVKVESRGELMTPEEFAEKMKALAANNDEEMFHICADGLMCELLASLGYSEGVDVFDKTPKWYS